MAQGPPDPPRRPRRWRVPPAPLQGNGQLEGIAILSELPGDTGGLLWQALRAVTLWAGVPTARRPGLFNPDVAGARRREIEQLPVLELQEPLQRILTVLTEPAGADAAAISAACVAVARWAGSRDARSTEMDFLSAAALASPSDPVLALTAARAFRDRGLYVHAEGWYQRTVALARRAGDWETYARAYVGLGKTWLAQDAKVYARRSYVKAYRAARRHGIRDVQGMALHDLFGLEAFLGNRRAALRMATMATRVYGPGHRLLPSLAHDVARFWLDRRAGGLALPVLRAVIPRIQPPGRTVAVGNLGLAAAYLEQPDTFEQALREILALPDDEPGKGEALSVLARGAWILGLREHAESTARMARTIVEARGEWVVLRDLDELRRTMEEGSGSTGALPPRVEDLAEEEAGIRLNRNLVAFLAASAPPSSAQ